MADRLDGSRNLTSFFPSKEETEKEVQEISNNFDKKVDQVQKDSLLQDAIDHIDNNVIYNKRDENRITKSIIVSEDLEERLKEFCFTARVKGKAKIKENHVIRQALHDFLIRFGY